MLKKTVWLGWAVVVAMAVGRGEAAESESAAASQATESKAADTQVARPMANREWITDLKAGLDQAKKGQQFVIVYFYSPKSDVCDQMQKETFDLSAVGEAIEDFVKVRLDATAERGFALLYQVQQVPAVIFLDREGRELDRFSGFADPGTFLKRTAEAVDPKTNYVLLKERLAANPDDVEALYYMGLKYSHRGNYDHAAQYFAKVSRLDKEDKLGFADNIVVRRCEGMLHKGDFEGALKSLDGFGQKYPTSDELDRAAFLRAQLLSLMGRTNEAVAAYQGFLSQFPDSDLAPRAQIALQAIAQLGQMAPGAAP